MSVSSSNLFADNHDTEQNIIDSGEQDINNQDPIEQNPTESSIEQNKKEQRFIDPVHFGNICQDECAKNGQKLANNFQKNSDFFV